MNDQQIASALKTKIERNELAGSADFARSLLTAFNRYGRFTPKQAVYAQRMATGAQATGTAVSSAGVERITAMFIRAKAAGLRRPSIVIATNNASLRISPAPDNGRNAGAVYIKNGARQYIGKVVNGKFIKSMDAGNIEAETALLVALANNPEQVAAVHGHATGCCCFCSRELTDARSVAVGYGPVCADNFGLSWGERRAEQFINVNEVVQ